MVNNYMELAGSFAGELKLLGSNLLEASSGKKQKTFLVTSSRNGEGKTLFSLSMARKLVRDDHLKVLLIDTDTQSPMLHKIFNLPASPGILNVIDNQLPIRDAIKPGDVEGLSILTIGKSTSKTNKHLRDDHLEKLFADIIDEYDYIIADGGAILGASETIMICSIFEAILLVVECSLTKAPVVANAKDKIISAGGNLLGVVLNRRKYYIPNRFYGT